MPQTRYLVASSWGHIFDDVEGERMTDWVLDRESNKLVAATYMFEHKVYDASPEMLADLEDSVVNANSECLESPGDWDLEETDDLPDWAQPAASLAP